MSKTFRTDLSEKQLLQRILEELIKANDFNDEMFRRMFGGKT